MKYDLLSRTPIRDLGHAQAEFDIFKHCYNFERPHGALDMNVPAKFFKHCNRVFIENPSEPEYGSCAALRKVNYKGYLSINKHRYFLSESFIGKYVELFPIDDVLISLRDGNFVIAQIDLSEQLFISRKIFRRA